MEGVNIKTKPVIFVLIFVIAIVASVSSISAASIELLDDEHPERGAILTDIEKSEAVNQLTVKNGDLLSSQSKGTYIKTGLRQKLSLKALAKNYEGKDIKVTSVLWTFSDGTKSNKLTTSKTFAKTGWYSVKMKINATGSGSYWGDKYDNLTWEGSTKTFKIYVVKQPDLKVTKLMRSVDSKNNVAAIRLIIKNFGTVDSKATQVKVWYESKSLKKYTKTVSVKPIKGVFYKKVLSNGKYVTKAVVKSTQVDIQFKIPAKYQNQIKYVHIDPNNKLSESIKSNNKIRF